MSGHVLSAKDRQALDDLMGVALVDDRVCQRLLDERPPALLDSFSLSRETQVWLRTVEASTLEELAQAILCCPSGPHSDVPS